MLKLSVTNNPNQTFLFDSKYGMFKITLRYLGTIVVCNVDFKGNNIVNGVRVVTNKWLIPYKYLYQGIGNFRFEGMIDDYPIFSDFGKSVNLIYYDNEEFSEARASE